MNILSFIKNISPIEWILILIILFIVFGGKMLTRLGKTGGESFKEIKKVKNSFMKAVEDDETKDKEVQK
jgi:Sec-independent protein translocase protein TatA